MAVFRTGTSIVPAPLPGVASASSYVETEESTSSATFTGLTTAQSVTLTTGSKVLVIIGCNAYNDNAGAGFSMSYAVSGATTIAASNKGAVRLNRNESVANIAYNMSNHSYITVTPGSNTFTLQFCRQNGAGTAYFGVRTLTVIDMGS
jgi:hypothetical protein